MIAYSLFKGGITVIILNTQYNILYTRLSDIIRRVVSCEDLLLGDFLPYQILPIPDEAPPNIPRIVMLSDVINNSLDRLIKTEVFSL